MLKKTLLTLTFCVIYALSVSAQQGKWKAYMAYRNVERPKIVRSGFEKRLSL